MAVNPSDVGRSRRADQPGAPATAPSAPATRRPPPPPGVSPASLQPGARSPEPTQQQPQPAKRSTTVTHRDLRGRRQQFEARKVRRLVRHIEPWSVLKLSLLLFLSLWLVFMIAAVIVWSVANGSGTIDKLETFVESNLGQSDFRFDGDFLFRQFGLIGLILTLAATLATTIGAVVFNLISDIIGGVWVTVIEEETTRPAPRES